MPDKSIHAPSIAEQPDLPIAEGYALLPRELTAENGAKALLIGEFHETRVFECPGCGGEDAEDCELCDGSGAQEMKLVVQWDTIKRIWRKAVQHFASQQPEVEYEDMPSHACDSRKVTCPSCGSVLLAGWVAVGDVREIIQRRQPPEVEQ